MGTAGAAGAGPASGGGVSDGDDVERGLVGREVEEALHCVIIEGTHRHRAEPEGDGLEVEVLRDVAGLQVDVTLGARAVPGGGALVDSGYHDGEGSAAYGALAEGGRGEVVPPIPVG